MLKFLRGSREAQLERGKEAAARTGGASGAGKRTGGEDAERHQLAKDAEHGPGYPELDGEANNMQRLLDLIFGTFPKFYWIQTSTEYFFPNLSVIESKHRGYIYIQITEFTENHPSSPLKFATITDLYGILIN